MGSSSLNHTTRWALCSDHAGTAPYSGPGIAPTVTGGPGRGTTYLDRAPADLSLPPIPPPPMRPTLRTLRAGFTLIELLAVMLIIGILMAFLVPQIPAAIDRANVTACRANMSAIAQGLMQYQTTYKHMPVESGVGFFGALIADEIWEADEGNTKRLTCPGIQLTALTPFLEDIPLGDWFVDREAIGPGYSAYAGRNTKEHPLRKFPISSSEALVSDDNDPNGNHRTTTVVLWGDTSVRELELVEQRKQGLVDEEDGWIRVGYDSPIEALQKLSITD